MIIGISMTSGIKANNEFATKWVMEGPFRSKSGHECVFNGEARKVPQLIMEMGYSPKLPQIPILS